MAISQKRVHYMCSIHTKRYYLVGIKCTYVHYVGQKESPCKLLIYMGFSVVARDGIEPPTRGFSVPCSTD